MPIPQASLRLSDISSDPRMGELYWAWFCFALTTLMAYHSHWLTLPAAFRKVQVAGKKGKTRQHEGMWFRSSCCSGEWAGTPHRENTQATPTHLTDSLSSTGIIIHINKAMHISEKQYRCSTCTPLGLCSTWCYYQRALQFLSSLKSMYCMKYH